LLLEKTGAAAAAGFGFSSPAGSAEAAVARTAQRRRRPSHHCRHRRRGEEGPRRRDEDSHGHETTVWWIGWMDARATPQELQIRHQHTASPPSLNLTDHLITCNIDFYIAICDPKKRFFLDRQYSIVVKPDIFKNKKAINIFFKIKG
jgi:hypothetical protein